MKKKKITLSIDSKVYASFQEYCEENAVLLSKRVELFMTSLIDKKKNLPLIIGFPFFLIFFVVIFSSLSFGLVFTDANKIDFDQGIYNLTFYNNSGFVQLNNSFLNGNFT